MPKSSKKVLVVEDEKPMAKALELKLKKAGIKVVVARDGEAAVENLKNEKFSLILLDLMMPKLNGFEVIEDLQASKNTTPVFVMSNLSQPGDQSKAKNLGAADFFVKSNTPIADIVERVKQKLK